MVSGEWMSSERKRAREVRGGRRRGKKAGEGETERNGSL